VLQHMPPHLWRKQLQRFVLLRLLHGWLSSSV
jgi:hypothetical protein